MIDRADEASVRRDISKSVEKLVHVNTPFGQLVQTINLPVPGGFKWQIIHPLALVFYLSTICPAFSSMLSSCWSAMLRIVLYIDEARPGNVLRPDHARATQNIFWIFADSPEWYVRRDMAWFTFGSIRTSIVSNLPGYVSELMKHVLHVFWSPTGSNFQTAGGLFVNPSGSTTVVKAKFSGFLGDEKGLKEIFNTKGYGGTKICIVCKNLVQFLDAEVDGQDYLVKCSCCDPTKFDRCTDLEVYEIVDTLKRAHAGKRKDFELLEQTLGVNYTPTGILCDEHCRTFVQPISARLNDWMHVFAVAGSANIEVEQIVHQLAEIGVKPVQLTEYFQQFHLPKSQGVVHPDWFTPKRLGRPSEHKDGWKGFASEVLTVVPILASFMELVIFPMGLLLRHIECFRMLDSLLKFFGLGADTSFKYVREIEVLIVKHAELFVELYPGVIKPKFHYQFHLGDHMRCISKLLSCFVTERKHRAIKAIASHSFRNFETVVLRDHLCGIVEKAQDGGCIFMKEYMVSPAKLSAVSAELLQGLGLNIPAELMSTHAAELSSGLIRKGDLIMLQDGNVGEVSFFIGFDSNEGQSIWCLFTLFNRVEGYKFSRPAVKSIVVVESSEVMCALVWCIDSGFIRVLRPRQSVVPQ